MHRTDEALQYFANGFNCAQSVLVVFADKLGISRETALKIATSFGGGMRAGEVCGAVSGALMALGLHCGHSVQGDMETKNSAYGQTVEFHKHFTEKNQSLVCRKLLGYDISDPNEKEKAMAVHDSICPGLICDAVRILEGMLS